MMKTLFFFLSVLSTGLLTAQAPANDICANAIPLTIYNSEDEAIPVEGDTRNTTDGALDGIPVCSGNFYRDDVWYTITTPDEVSASGYAIKIYYNGVNNIPAFGLALYNSCDAGAANQPFFCGNADNDVFYWNDEGLACLSPNQTVYIRVWSAVGDAANWQAGAGLFRIAVFPRAYLGRSDVNVIWGDQPGQGDFAGGLNGWTQQSITCNGAASDSALWLWDDSGWPYWIWGSQQTERIKSKTLCDGVMVFESMFKDIGADNVPGSGACPQPHEGALVSPVIDMTGFDPPGVSVIFNQSMQRWREGLHFLDYSTDGGVTWVETEINEEKGYLSTDPSTGTGYYNEEYRVRLEGAENADSLRIRFRFQGASYWWIIDDVRIIETECNNTSLNGRESPWRTIAPWAKIPADQVFPYPVLADVFNAGACEQTNVTLQHTVENGSGKVVSDLTLDYGTLDPDSLAENQLFGSLVTIPELPGEYTGTFTLTQDAPDFDESDNTFSYSFATGGFEFALEDGNNGGIWPAAAEWNDGAPRSWVYGNFFMPAKTVRFNEIAWGVNNPDVMEGHTVNVVLYQWTDTNGDDVCAFTERRYIGLREYTFTGDEVPGEMIYTTLENFESPNPEDPIFLQAGMGYIAVIEHQALSADDPVLELMGSNDRDYSAIIFAFNEAFDAGLTDRKFFASILAVPEDGSLSQIDYGTAGFNGGYVPNIRIVAGLTIDVNEPLPATSLVSVFPNPAKESIQVKMEFEEAYAQVQIRLIDPLGRIIYTRSLEQAVAQHIETIAVRDLAAGSYLLQVETPAGQRSLPVMIIK